jgi:hypothetical protein
MSALVSSSNFRIIELTQGLRPLVFLGKIMVNQLKVILLTLAVAAGTAQAQTFASVNSMFATGLNGASDQSGYQFVVGHRMNNITIDANTETLISDTNKATVNRIEGGASFSLPTGTGLTPYVRTALGSKTVGGNQFAYYSAEPGVRMAIGPGTARLGWRYRSAVDDAQFNDTTRTWRVGYVMPVNKSLDVSIAYETARGDINYNGLLAGFTVRF